MKKVWPALSGLFFNHWALIAGCAFILLSGCAPSSTNPLPPLDKNSDPKIAGLGGSFSDPTVVYSDRTAHRDIRFVRTESGEFSGRH